MPCPRRNLTPTRTRSTRRSRAINKISANTTFAGDQLIDGSKAYTTQVSSADAAKLNSYQLNSVAFSGNSTVPVTATVKTAATQGQLFYNFVNGGLATTRPSKSPGPHGTNVVFLGQGSSLVRHQVGGQRGVERHGRRRPPQTAAVYGTATFGTAGSNNGLTFTDIRSQADQPRPSTSIPRR